MNYLKKKGEICNKINQLFQEVLYIRLGDNKEIKRSRKINKVQSGRMFFQFRVRVKLHEESESGPKSLKKVYFQAQIGLFGVLGPH